MRLPRVPERWRRRAAIARGYFPLTVAGIVVAAAAAFAWRSEGKGHADYVLYAAGIVGLGIVVASVLATVLATAALAWRLHARARTTAPLDARIDTGLELSTGFACPRMTLWPLVELELAWDAPTPTGALMRPTSDLWALHERARFRERGHIDRLVRRFTVRDVFGLASLSFSRTARVDLMVTPALAPVEHDAARRVSSGEGFSHPSGEPEGDLVEMRRYGPGDPLRNILWKTFARTRRLLVRMPERSLQVETNTVAYLVAGPSDEASAAVARTFVERGLLGHDYLFAADGGSHPTGSVTEALAQIVESARFRDRGGSGLERLLHTVEPSRLGNCLLFVPARVGDAWLACVAAFCARLPRAPSCLIGLDLPDDLDTAGATPPRERRWRRVAFSRRADLVRAGDDLDAVAALHAQLLRFGADVRLIDRGSGRALAVSDLDRLRRI